MSASVRHSLTVKFAALFGIFAILVATLVCLISYASYSSSMLEHYGRYAIGTATLAASKLDPDELLHYAKTLTRDERYGVIEAELEIIRKSVGVKYLYVQMPVSDSKYMYLFDVYDPDEEEEEGPITELGALGNYDHNFEAAKHAMSTGEPTRKLDITRSVYGYLASAYIPIQDKNTGDYFAYVGVDISMDYIIGFLTRYLTVIASATAIVMALSFSALFFLVRRLVVNPIKTIAAKTGEFTRNVDNINFKGLQISSNDEIGDLSASVNMMFGEIRDFASRLAEETARHERVQSELNMAKAIQESVLPKDFPPFLDYPDSTIFASMAPAKEVGGDFYDFFVVGKNKLAFAIADTSGKGIPAALFMMKARTLIKTHALSGNDPRELLEAANNQLCQNNDTGMFVTAFIGILDTKLNILRYANAGHMPPILLRGSQVGWMPVVPGLALGVLENISFVTQEIAFEKDDLLLLYTDGVTEAVDKKDELFGNKRLMSLLSMKLKEAAEIESTISPKELIQTVSDAIKQFAADAEQADDITMLAIRKTIT